MKNKLIVITIVLAFSQCLLGSYAIAGSTVAPTDRSKDQPVNSGGKSAANPAPQIERFVISNGIVNGLWGGETIVGTIGQPIIGTGTFGANSITYGFHAGLYDQGCCIGIRGNVLLEPECDASDQTVDIADLTAIISALFINFEPICCLEEADISPASPDGVVDIGDLTALIAYLFITYTPPPDCP